MQQHFFVFSCALSKFGRFRFGIHRARTIRVDPALRQRVAAVVKYDLKPIRFLRRALHRVGDAAVQSRDLIIGRRSAFVYDHRAFQLNIAALKGRVLIRIQRIIDGKRHYLGRCLGRCRCFGRLGLLRRIRCFGRLGLLRRIRCFGRLRNLRRIRFGRHLRDLRRLSCFRSIRSRRRFRLRFSRCLLHLILRQCRYGRHKCGHIRHSRQQKRAAEQQ